MNRINAPHRVFGNAAASSGVNFGVFGTTNRPEGYGVFCSGPFKSTGRTYLGAPNSAPTASTLSDGSLSFYLDEANNKLRIRVRYSNGIEKTGTVNLT